VAQCVDANNPFLGDLKMDEITTVAEGCTGQPSTPGVMKLYKFRSLERFEYVVDILVNQRFYMASVPELNDPMEGVFHAPGFSDQYRQAMEKARERYRICSFFQSWTDPRYWAHYADGFKGICIEIETDRNRVAWSTVDYGPLPLMDEGTMYAYSMLPQLLLERKLETWDYEQEVRAILPIDNQHLTATGKWTMRKVLLGLRTPRAMREVIRQITPSSVQVWTTKINDMDEIGTYEEFGKTGASP